MAWSGPAADLVLLDLHMPGLGGMEVLRRLREAGNDVPVVFVTAHGSVPDVVAGDEARRHRLPRQAAPPDALRELVAEVLERHAPPEVAAGPAGPSPIAVAPPFDADLTRRSGR